MTSFLCIYFTLEEAKPIGSNRNRPRLPYMTTTGNTTLQRQNLIPHFLSYPQGINQALERETYAALLTRRRRGGRTAGVSLVVIIPG